MSAAVVDQVIAAAPLDLRHSELALLSCLARIAGPDGRPRWPVGTAQLVRMTRYSEASIKRARRRLVERGLVRVLRRGHGDTRTEYAVSMPVREAAEPVENQVARAHGDPPPGVAVTPPYQVLTRDTPLPQAAPRLGGLSSPACRRAARRGRPCGRCRRCATNPRAENRALALARPPWCGSCDERIRYLDADGDAPSRCPACHPAMTSRRTA